MQRNFPFRKIRSKKRLTNLSSSDAPRNALMGARSTGKARYGIDVRVPNMLHASVERAPWLGAKPLHWDKTAAKAYEWIRDVVAVSSGVAVVANSSWSAIKGRNALAVKWSDQPDDGFESKKHRERLEQACQERGTITRKGRSQGFRTR